MLIRNVEIQTATGRQRTDVRIRQGRIDAIGSGLTGDPGAPVVEGAGGALLPGLHDHHIHLLSLAAALESIRCGPPQVDSPEALAAALADAASRPGDGWIRGVGYHESVAGDLDATALSKMAPTRATRIQHRSGALWIVNEPGLIRLGLSSGQPSVDAPSGAERHPDGRFTGRFYRCDAWLRGRLGTPSAPDLARTGAVLTSYGVTGVTDATPTNRASELTILSRAVARGDLPLALQLMGDATLPEPSQPGVRRGALKLILDEARQLDLDDTADAMRAAHASGRPVAIHCVTRAELVVALAAFELAGVQPGDRIEHASIAPPELAAKLSWLGIAVVTQPNFVRERGDDYLRDVEPDDQPWLYRCAGLLDAGVSLGGSTDAPFGDPDPWRAMQAAVDRRTAAGARLGESEALSPEAALALFTTAPDVPGGEPRRIRPGGVADLCLLDRAWDRARDQLDGQQVLATWRAGARVFSRV